MSTRRKFTVEQVIVLLHEVEHMCAGGDTVREAVAKCGLSISTYYRWREKYGWLDLEETNRLKKLEEENQRLKQLVEMWSSLFSKSSNASTNMTTGHKQAL